MNAQPEEEAFCPRCGHWVPELRDKTGWCTTCSISVAVAVKRAYRDAHPEAEKRRNREHRERMGTGQCSHCGRGGLYLRTNGGVCTHPYRRIVGNPQCPGSGLAPA